MDVFAVFAHSFSAWDEPGDIGGWGSALSVLQENRAEENKTDVEEDLQFHVAYQFSVKNNAVRFSPH